MAHESLPSLHLIRRLINDPEVRWCPDKELLRRFLEEADEAAFETLVRRHGPLVLDVCRSVLFNAADVDDAFQATFLLLARKACSIRKTESLASWLHGVAYRMACKIRTAFARRKKHEGRVPGGRVTQPDNLAWNELRQILHEELTALSERHRVPLLLCYLEGKTQDEAAELLGIAKSTLKKRLERGRAVLRIRLVRRGLGAPALLLLSAWPTATQAGVATSLVLSTVKAATMLAAGSSVGSAVSVKVAALVQGGLNAMTLAKLKLVMVFLVVVGVLSAGAVGLARQSGGMDKASPQQVIEQEQPQTLEERKAAAQKSAVQQAQEAQEAQEAARKALAAQQHKKAQEGLPGKKDEEGLRDIWTCVSGEAGGKALPAEVVTGYRLIFAEGKVTVQSARESKEGTFRLNSAVRPGTIDLDLDGGTGIGIYRLDGDSLQLCFVESGKEDRPGEFSTREGSRRVLLMLKREPRAKLTPEKKEMVAQGEFPQVAALKEQVRALEATNGMLKEALKQSRAELEGMLTKVDIEKNTISFSLKGTKLTLEAVPLTGDVRFFLGDREVTINDLRKGQGVSLQVRTEGERTIVTTIKIAKKSEQ